MNYIYWCKTEYTKQVGTEMYFCYDNTLQLSQASSCCIIYTDI